MLLSPSKAAPWLLAGHPHFTRDPPDTLVLCLSLVFPRGHILLGSPQLTALSLRLRYFCPFVPPTLTLLFQDIALGQTGPNCSRKQPPKLGKLHFFGAWSCALTDLALTISNKDWFSQVIMNIPLASYCCCNKLSLACGLKLLSQALYIL